MEELLRKLTGWSTKSQCFRPF